MASKKTWIWIIVSTLVLCVVALVAVAATGIYFVTRHIATTHATTSTAQQAFDTTRAGFKDQRPLIELDKLERPRNVRPLTEMPTSPTKPTQLWVLAWNPNEERLVKISLPFWMLKLGRRKLDIASGGGFDLDRLNLDVHELERIGPALVLDITTPAGERVLLWTH